MPSVTTRALSLLFRVTRKPQLATVERARRRIDAPKDDPAPPAPLRHRYRVTEREVAGFPVYTVQSSDGPEPQRAVLYLHGGAYVSSITPWHWRLIALMADQGCRVEVPLYGLAPGHTHREAHPFLDRVWADLVADVPASRTVLAGDSAGGGLAVALDQRRVARGQEGPARMILIAPCVETTLTHPGIAEIEPHDPWLATVGLHECVRAWAGGDDPADPRLSPLYGAHEGTAPMDVYVGTHDLLLPDLRRLRERRSAAGARTDLITCPGAFHVYPLVPCPEGRRARLRILASLRRL